MGLLAFLSFTARLASASKIPIRPEEGWPVTITLGSNDISCWSLTKSNELVPCEWSPPLINCRLAPKFENDIRVLSYKCKIPEGSRSPIYKLSHHTINMKEGVEVDIPEPDQLSIEVILKHRTKLRPDINGLAKKTKTDKVAASEKVNRSEPTSEPDGKEASGSKTNPFLILMLISGLGLIAFLFVMKKPKKPETTPNGMVVGGSVTPSQLTHMESGAIYNNPLNRVNNMSSDPANQPPNADARLTDTGVTGGGYPYQGVNNASGPNSPAQSGGGIYPGAAAAGGFLAGVIADEGVRRLMGSNSHRTGTSPRESLALPMPDTCSHAAMDMDSDESMF